MDDQFVRLHITGTEVEVERGVPTTYATSRPFHIDNDGNVDGDDLREIAKLLQQALDGEFWEGEPWEANKGAGDER